MYKSGDFISLTEWSDSNYVGDTCDIKITSGYLFMIRNGAISWSSKKQPIATLSTREAEFVVEASCS